MTVAGTSSESNLGARKDTYKSTEWMWGSKSLKKSVNSKVEPSPSGDTNDGPDFDEVEPFEESKSEIEELGKLSDAAAARLEGIDEDGEDAGGRARPSEPRVAEPLRRQIHQTMDDASYSDLAKFISLFMMLIIILSTLCFILESEATNVGGVLYGGSAEEIFEAIELGSVIVFTLEYNIRLFTCNRLFNFVFDIMNLIDLVAWLPFWVTLAIQIASGDSSSSSSFGFVRIIRLVRVFRVFKFGRYSIGIQMFVGAIVKSRQPLMVLVFMVGISTTIISSVMYLVEDGATDDMLTSMGVDKATHDVCYGTIPRTFWWCLVTMTTVGYGDCYPLSFAGKLLAMATMLLGVLILALPITVVGSNFHKMVEMFEEDMDDYTRTDKDDSGNIDEMELREFIRKQKRDGRVKKGTDLNIQRLMSKYDPQGNGTLSLLEFTHLKNDVLDDSKADPSAVLTQITKMLSQQSEQIESLQAQMRDLQSSLGGKTLTPNGGPLGGSQQQQQQHSGGHAGGGGLSDADETERTNDV